MEAMKIKVKMLGQSGCRLALRDIIIYIDPYLSNSVQEYDSEDLERLLPIPLHPEEIKDASFILITHEHLDHCDPKTLIKISEVSPNAFFIAPKPVIDKLIEWGVNENRIQLAKESWHELSVGINLRAVPSAHPEIERDAEKNLTCVGYLLEWFDKRIYIAGDTSVHPEIIETLNKEGPIHTAFLPVNEDNYFRRRRGIIGNMSVREALQFAEEIKVSQVVPVHWDMFSVNSAYPEEIKIIHGKLGFNSYLTFSPSEINFVDVNISIIIRTLNEAEYLSDLLDSIHNQVTEDLIVEVVLVDSGSTDNTIEIAKAYGCRILHIDRKDFSFGRSLNVGCNAAHGEVLVFISGHCVPTDGFWLSKLSKPLLEGAADYCYGRQLGGPNSHFSENRIFSKYYPHQSQVPQIGGFCNNANSALTKTAWEKYQFDEALTGLEDMELASRLVADGGLVAYLADAAVFHYHNETWGQIKRRFEREAIALPFVMPQINMRRRDLCRYIVTSIWSDFSYAFSDGCFIKHAFDIVRYRFCQYWGAYNGNHLHRELSYADKEKYFFPTSRINNE